MKFSMLLAILVVGFTAHAGQEGQGVGAPLKPLRNAKAIYRALNVREITGGHFDTVWTQKSVGGLVCRATHFSGDPAAIKYNCLMNPRVQPNYQAIYRAMRVKAIAINPGIAGSGAFSKSVGGLTCTMRQVIYPHAPVDYSCTLQ